uniref:Uncharacterized protein n=1 Tax=Lactuca sativa TaxID=4236 RepID=A0A9R1WR05_LACSA|nr:hypothetical protein LSAT_V11C100014980 [Lactuca sativa]
MRHLGQASKESLPNAVVYDMITSNNTSEFGYDNVNRCGTVESPDVCDSYVKVHKGAEKWRNKSLPHYDDSCIIFGKDRAQWNMAEDCEDM